MTITARYASRCACCHQPITVGQQIEWSRGTPARHVECSTARVESPRRPFRCRRCGDTRDTTISGYCDDCDA